MSSSPDIQSPNTPKTTNCTLYLRLLCLQMDAGALSLDMLALILKADFAHAQVIGKFVPYLNKLTRIQTSRDPETGKPVVTFAAQTITESKKYIKVRQATYKHRHRLSEHQNWLRNCNQRRAEEEAARDQAEQDEQSLILIETPTTPESDATVLPSTPRPACASTEAERECTAATCSPIGPSHSFANQLCGASSPYEPAHVESIDDCMAIHPGGLLGLLALSPMQF